MYGGNIPKEIRIVLSSRLPHSRPTRTPDPRRALDET